MDEQKIHLRQCMLYEFDRGSTAAEATQNRVLSPNSAAKKKFFSNPSIAQVLGIGQSCILFSGIE
jgi:hypothetical protein